MSAADLCGRPEFAGIRLVAKAMQGAGLPQHLRDRALSHLVGEKIRRMAVQAEHSRGHLLSPTPFDGCTGDPRLN